MRNKLALLTSLLMFSLLIGSVNAITTTYTDINFLFNPSFEVTGNGSGTLAAWEGSQVGGEFYTGSSCASVLNVVMENQANTFTLSYSFDNKPQLNSVERFTFWAKGASEFDAVRVFVYTEQETISYRFDLTLSWAQYTFDLSPNVWESYSATNKIEGLEFNAALNPNEPEPEMPYNNMAYLDDVFLGYTEITTTRDAGIDLTYFYYALYAIIGAGFVTLFVIVAKAKSNQR